MELVYLMIVFLCCPGPAICLCSFLYLGIGWAANEMRISHFEKMLYITRAIYNEEVSLVVVYDVWNLLNVSWLKSYLVKRFFAK